MTVLEEADLRGGDVNARTRDGCGSALRATGTGTNAGRVVVSCSDTPLHFAAENGQLEATQWLLCQGAAVDTPNRDGYCCAHCPFSNQRDRPTGISSCTCARAAVLRNACDVKGFCCCAKSALHLERGANRMAHSVATCCTVLHHHGLSLLHVARCMLHVAA